jgi:hypothetical protein
MLHSMLVGLLLYLFCMQKTELYNNCATTAQLCIVNQKSSVKFPPQNKMQKNVIKIIPCSAGSVKFKPQKSRCWKDWNKYVCRNFKPHMKAKQVVRPAFLNLHYITHHALAPVLPQSWARFDQDQTNPIDCGLCGEYFTWPGYSVRSVLCPVYCALVGSAR